MMENPDRVVPPWAVPHIPDFRRLGRVVDLASGFMLVPVELSGPDVARALAAWLSASGRPVVVVEPAGEEAWSVVTAMLLDVQPDSAGAVALIGTREPSRGLRAGLRLLNQRRDTIAGHLGRPLLWCGPKEFLDTTWRSAPDFWSIADVPRRLEAAAAVNERQETLEVFTDIPSDSPEDLRALYEDAKAQGDRRNAARIGTQLANVLLFRGEYERTKDVATQVLGLLEGLGEPGLEAPAHEVLGRLLFFKGALDASERELQVAFDKFRAAGDRRGAAISLGGTARIRRIKGKVDEALELHEQALKVFEELGDRRERAVALGDIARIRRIKGEVDEALKLQMSGHEVRADSIPWRRAAAGADLRG
jgi:tetratricopeptide (TPR) repeat protein